MRKLLASDYDGTLNTFEYDLRFNIPFIKRFIESGHLFVLNTGRSYQSIRDEINRFNIPYSYLSCNDGNLLLNRGNKIIYTSNINENTNYLIHEFASIEGIQINVFTHQGKILEYELVVKHLTDSFFIRLQNLCLKLHLSYKVFKILFVSRIYVMQEEISKSHTINLISELENIDKCDIFTIGDNSNDVEMIRDFNGYTLPWGKREVKDVSNGTCLCVASLVKRIMR